MSILFDALNKAARDYRRQQTQVVVPLMPSPNAAPKASRVAMVCAVALIAGGIGFWGGQGEAPQDQSVDPTVASQAASPLHPPKTSKLIRDNSSGIELPAEALLPDDKEGRKLRRVAEKIADAPALAQESDVPQSRIAVTQERGVSSLVSVDEIAPRVQGKQALLAQASAAIDAKNWDLALATYDRLMQNDKNDIDSALAKAFVLEQRSGTQDLDAIERMIIDKPEVSAFHATRARILLRQNNNEQALEAWKRAVIVDPNNNAYRTALAVMYDRAGLAPEALAAYRAIKTPLTADIRARMAYLQAQLSGGVQDFDLRVAADGEE